MKAICLTLILSLSCFVTFGQEPDANYLKKAGDFVACIKSQNKEKLAEMIVYPLSRKYPLPGIKDKEDLINRYDEVFDRELIKVISGSNLKTDWDAIGWRGITLQLPSGSVWLNDEGKLIALNYQSVAERNRREALINAEKAGLHTSVKTFKEPVLILKTAKYKIRIDDMGDQNYRYASWPLESSMGDQPELIVTNGQRIPEGSGYNCRYDFQDGDYRYECLIINDIKKASHLSVYKGDLKILAVTAHQQILF